MHPQGRQLGLCAVATAVVSGAGGLIGAESSAFLCEQGFDVIGVENDLRAQFFGPAASTARQVQQLHETYESFRHENSSGPAHEELTASR